MQGKSKIFYTKAEVKIKEKNRTLAYMQKKVYLCSQINYRKETKQVNETRIDTNTDLAGNHVDSHGLGYGSMDDDLGRNADN